MRVWAIFWLFIVAAVAAFSVLNWSVLTAQTSISLLFVQVAAPLGLVMLGAMGTFALLFLLFLVWLETSTLLHLRSSSNVSGRLDRLEQMLRDELGRINSTLLARGDAAEAFRKVG
jgi:hypothetical protein